jgi:hypothetical protein
MSSVTDTPEIIFARENKGNQWHKMWSIVLHNHVPYM